MTFSFTKLSMRLQEFLVSDYTLEDFPGASWDDITGPPLRFFLPQTHFYAPCPEGGYESAPEPWSTKVLIHPRAIGLDSRHMPVFAPMDIERPDLCQAGQVLMFPVVEKQDGAKVLDPFKALEIMEVAGIPPYMLERERELKMARLKQAINTFEEAERTANPVYDTLIAEYKEMSG